MTYIDVIHHGKKSAICLGNVATIIYKEMETHFNFPAIVTTQVLIFCLSEHGSADLNLNYLMDCTITRH